MNCSLSRNKQDSNQAMVQMVADYNKITAQLDEQKMQTSEILNESTISRAALENYETFMIDLGIDKAKWTEVEPQDLANEYRRDQQGKQDDLFRYGLIAGSGGFVVILLYLFIAAYLLRNCWKKSKKQQSQVVNPLISEGVKPTKGPSQCIITNEVSLVFAP